MPLPDGCGIEVNIEYLGILQEHLRLLAFQFRYNCLGYPALDWQILQKSLESLFHPVIYLNHIL